MKRLQSPVFKQSRRIEVDTSGNPLLSNVLSIINNNEEIHTLWQITNVTAVDWMGMTDHSIDKGRGKQLFKDFYQG